MNLDMEAPKGRLILPQVQTLRDLLDHGAVGVVVRERELHGALKRVGRPDLVVTDAQAFLKVACTHHAQGDDIGRVKIPRWLRNVVGGDLDLQHVAGRDFPEDLAGARLVVQCGGCTLNRREVLARQARARAAGVPMTNYGMAIAWCLGIFERALRPVLPG